MTNEYVVERNGTYYLATVRISLGSIVHAFNRGDSPETIMTNFELIEKPSEVYGAIAFYLDHKVELDGYLEESERQFEANCIPLAETDPALWERLQRARGEVVEHRP